MLSVVNTSGTNLDSKSKPLASTHGKLLLQELSLPLEHSWKSESEEFASRYLRAHYEAELEAKIEKILKYLKLDKNACILKHPMSGNTAYHLLLGGDYPEQLIEPLLKAFIETNPLGLSIKNKAGNLPLHCCLYQPVILERIALTVLEANPAAASAKNNSELIPLFFAVMRENSSFELCKALCKANPDGPRTPNSTNSLPLHFACRRRKPNEKIIQMLLKRHSAGAGQRNDLGMLPLHILSSHSCDLKCVKMVADAYPEAVMILDRQGRTCLHLAVLAIGKEHEASVAREQDEELVLLRDNQASTAPAAAEEIEDFDLTLPVAKAEDLREFQDGLSRSVLRYFIEKHPPALVALNNFYSTPVDTVLEKAMREHKSQKATRLRVLRVYGKYDDPPTARMLLCSHVAYASKGKLPPISAKHRSALRDLNWGARRTAVQVSYAGVGGRVFYGSSGQQSTKPKAKKTSTSTAGNDAPVIDKKNILSRLRFEGYAELVVLCVSWI